MAMLKMNLPLAMQQLGYTNVHHHRMAERRLADFCRTFDYSLPTAKLDLPLWRAMTCILVQTVMLDMDASSLSASSSSSSSSSVASSPVEEPSVHRQSDQLPPFVVAVHMTQEEYTYLIRSAFQSLGHPSTAVTE